MRADEARGNGRARAAGPPGYRDLACYPETRIGAFDFYAATRTEPPWSGSADVQRACGGSWLGGTEDLCCFTQEDPIPAITRAYSYVGNRPLGWRDPTGLIDTFVIKPPVSGPQSVTTGPCGGSPGCVNPETHTNCNCVPDCGSRWRVQIEINWVLSTYMRNDQPRKGDNEYTLWHETGHIGSWNAYYPQQVAIVNDHDGRAYPSKILCETACEVFYARNSSLALEMGFVHHVMWDVLVQLWHKRFL